MENLTLEFENPRVLQSLYANDDRLLKQMETDLGVRVTTRDGWIKIEGEQKNIQAAKRVFEQLEDAKKRGVTISRHEFRYALGSATSKNGDNLSGLLQSRIVCSAKKPPVVPKTQGQQQYLEAIQAHDVIFGVGPAGTGKTYLAMAAAVSALKQEKVARIILTRPAVEAGEALGFLPGDLQEKILPYLRPLYDALYDMLEVDEIQKYMDRGVVEIAPLAYMRGRTLNHSFVILDESQNTTSEQMFMFLTRLGMDSKCIITGDHTQIDLPRNKQSGLVEAISALKDVKGIAFNFFEHKDVVRHPLVQNIIQAYQVHREGSLQKPTK